MSTKTDLWPEAPKKNEEPNIPADQTSSLVVFDPLNLKTLTTKAFANKELSDMREIMVNPKP